MQNTEAVELLIAEGVSSDEAKEVVIALGVIADGLTTDYFQLQRKEGKK